MDGAVRSEPRAPPAADGGRKDPETAGGGVARERATGANARFVFLWCFFFFVVLFFFVVFFFFLLAAFGRS